MSKTILLTVGVVVLLLGAGITVWQRGMVTVSKESQTEGTPQQPQRSSSFESTGTPLVQNASSRYIDYSPSAYEKYTDKKRVLFFKASWCPTCNAANEEYIDNLSSIPEDVVILKVDYDKETELKKQYSITYQHTFVQVDKNGNALTKWNGGGVEELRSNLK